MTKEEKELNEIANRLEIEAESCSWNPKKSLFACLYRGWTNQIKNGDATLKDAKQMLNAANIRL